MLGEKEPFLCLVVLVLRARPEGNPSKRECAGCEGSRVIFPALLLILDKYSSWRVGRVVQMIFSAVRTTLRSLLRSDLVAELNQTVIDVQRTDSMMGEFVVPRNVNDSTAITVLFMMVSGGGGGGGGGSPEVHDHLHGFECVKVC